MFILDDLFAPSYFSIELVYLVDEGHLKFLRTGYVLDQKDSRLLVELCP